MINDRLVAHRGYQKAFPENTLLSLQKAIEAGAHFVELDVQFTADQRPVIYHDPLMRRVSGITQAIGAITLDEAIQIPAYEPERLGEDFKEETIAPLSSLAPLLTRHPKVQAFVEVKYEAVEYLGIEKSFEVVTAATAAAKDQCILISFHSAFIEFAKANGYPNVGTVANHWEDLTGERIEKLAPDYVFCDIKIIPDDAILNDFPFILVVYEVANPDTAIALFQRGVDMIETFDIKGMIEALGHRAI